MRTLLTGVNRNMDLSGISGAKYGLQTSKDGDVFFGRVRRCYAGGTSGGGEGVSVTVVALVPVAGWQSLWTSRS